MKRGPGSLLGLFARSSRSESEHTARKETAARVGAGVLGAAALAALFLGVRHYQGRSLVSLLAILRDVTIDEETKRKALLAASPEDRARVLADLPEFATLVTGYAASTITQICDALCLVPESAAELGRNQRRSILGCRDCCLPAQEFGTIEIEQAQVQNGTRGAACMVQVQSHHYAHARFFDPAPLMAGPAEFTEPELVRRVRANVKGSGAALAHVLNAHGCDGAPQRIVDLLIVPTNGRTQVLAALGGIAGYTQGTIHVRLEAIVPILEGASFDELSEIGNYVLHIDRTYDYNTLHSRLVRDDQCLVAGFMAHKVREKQPAFRPTVGAKATLGERIRYATGRYERHITADKALCADILASSEKLSDMDALRAHYILRAEDKKPFDVRLLEKRYTGNERMLIMLEMFPDHHVNDAVLKSARFMRGLVHATTYALAWLPPTALTELDDLSMRAVLSALKRPNHTPALWAHIQTLVPKGAPTASVLEVLAAGIARAPALNETAKRSLAGSVARWPVSFHTQASIAAVLGSGQLTCENAPAIVDCAIQAERGGFTEAARAMCAFAGQAAVNERLHALAPAPDLVHLAIAAQTADKAIIKAIQGSPTLAAMLDGKARRNEAGVVGRGLATTENGLWALLYTE